MNRKGWLVARCKQPVRPHLVLGILASLTLAPTALAELTVIYDSGQTRPLAPLLRPLLPNQPPVAGATGQKPNSLAPASTLGPADLRNLLPVQSPGLQVGDIAGRQLAPAVMARLAQGNPRPFFLVGSDEVSLRWLAHHRATLQSLGAVGMLVQAATAEDVRRVVVAAQGLPMTLGAADDLASALGIDRYPILITREGLQQ
ncbi:MAG: PFL_4695 family integrating conjugative element protein [Parahaliea sp.]